MTPPLTDRVAVVTGGTGALGQAVVLRLLADGARVAIPYVVEAERDRLAARLPATAADRVFTAFVDVSDLSAMTDFGQVVRDRFGRLDILVSAVGGFAGGTLLETDRSTWDRMLELNLTSAFVAARAVAPHMVAADRGRIVFVASRAVIPPGPGVSAYTVSKSGVVTLTQALALELRERGVTVNAVLPSTMDTPGNRAAMPEVDPRSWVPPDAVAEAIAFLVRDTSAHVTGTLLAI
jgi:NAD(P)-dependent dehydrogenase (short-subunit alcohol dehydrogenase family)